MNIKRGLLVPSDRVAIGNEGRVSVSRFSVTKNRSIRSDVRVRVSPRDGENRVDEHAQSAPMELRACSTVWIVNIVGWKVPALRGQKSRRASCFENG